MSELLLPGASYPPAEKFYIIDDRGREVEIRVEDFWMYGPDAWTGDTTYVDLANLPKEEWRKQGENDE